MKDFEYYNPTKIIFGKDSLAVCGSEIKKLQKNKVMVLYDGVYIEKSGLLSEVHQSLIEEGLEYLDVSGIKPNPRLSFVEEQVILGRNQKVDFVLAMGGGSVIDSAKAISLGIANKVSLKDLLLGKAKVDQTLGVGVISTLAGSGSESSCSMILTIDEGNLKRTFDSDLILPAFAILSPELTYTVPQYQMVSGGVDILMHTLERYFAQEHESNLIDSMSEALVKTTMVNLMKSIQNPKNYQARANLMWAGNISHNGLLETGRIADWACHRLEHELSGMFDVTHGAGLCALWSSWARYVYHEDIERFAQFAVNIMGISQDFYHTEEVALLGIEAFERYLHQVGMPITLSELGLTLTEKEIRQMAENCLLNSDGTIGHFQPLQKQDIVCIYQMAK